MIRTGRRHLIARLDGRGEAHTTSGDSAAHGRVEQAESGDPPAIGRTVGSGSRATSNSYETGHAEDPSCALCSGEPATTLCH